MTQFGQPTRTAAQDANEGKVDVPSVREQVKAQGIRAHKAQEKTGKSTAEVLLPVINEGVRRFQQYAEKNVEDKNEDLRIQGAIAQGENRAIVDIEGVEKRTGLSEYLFGQNAKYEGAQRQAVRNNVREWGTAAKKEIASHVGKSPEEYRNTINAQFNEHIKTFEGDPETQELLRKEYSVQAERLMDGYTKERYVHTQNESRKEASRTIGNAFDEAIVDAENVVPGTSDFDRVYDAYRGAFDYDTFMANNPDVAGITPENYQEIVVENLIESIGKDNKQAYQAAQQLGFTDQLNSTLRGQLDAAEAKRVERSDMQSVYAQANFNAEVDNANTWDAYQSLRDTFADNNNADPKRWPAKEWLKYEAKIRRNIAAKERSNSKVRKGAAAMTAQEQLVAGQEFYRGDLVGTQKERDAAKNAVMIGRLNNGVIQEADLDKSPEELAQVLWEDPAKVTLLANTLQDVSHISPAEQVLARSVADNLPSAGAEGYLSDSMNTRLGALLAYNDKNPTALATMTDAKTVRKLMFYHKQASMGIPLKDINASWNGLREHVDTSTNWGVYKDAKGKIKDHTEESALRALLEKRTGSTNVSDFELNNMRDSYREWLQIHGNQQAALQSTIDEMNARDDVFLHRQVPNGRTLSNKMEEWRTSTKGTVLPTERHGEESEEVGLARIAGLRADSAGNLQIPHYPADVSTLLQYGQQHGMFDMTFTHLGILTDPNTKQFETDQLQTTLLTMQVPYGTDVLRITNHTKTGPVVSDVTLDILQEIQHAYSVDHWKQDQYAILDKRLRQEKFLSSQSRGHIQFDDEGNMIGAQ